jgi:hypothetical protein
MKFDVLMVVLVFWVVVPCGQVGRYHYTYKSTQCYYPEDQLHMSLALMLIDR